MTVNSTIDGTGSNVTLNRQTTIMQAVDQNYSGPGTEPYASLISVPTAVPEPSSVPEIDPNSLGSVLALVLGSLGLLERGRLKAA